MRRAFISEDVRRNLHRMHPGLQMLRQGPQINNMNRQKSCYYHYHQYTSANNYERHINLFKDAVIRS